MRVEKDNIKVVCEKNIKLSSENIFIDYIFPALEVLLAVLRLKLYVNAVIPPKITVRQVS